MSIQTRSEFGCQVCRGVVLMPDGELMSRSVYCTKCAPAMPEGCQAVCVPAQGEWGEPLCALRDQCPCWAEHMPLARIEAYRDWLFGKWREMGVGIMQDAPVKRRREVVARESDVQVCPECGGEMGRQATLCKACANRKNGLDRMARRRVAA